jgi:DNA-binding transcriptional MerR regulator
VRKIALSGADRVGLLTVGQTAKILGVSPSTLRLWENVGIITPVRSNGHYRLYSRELLEVLKRIKYLRDVKRLNLPGIKEILGHGQQKAAPSRQTANGGPTDVGRKLREMRKRQGIGLAEAARQAKVSVGFVSAIELSRANPSVATLQRLTAAYGTTVLDLYDMPRRPKRLVRPRERRVIETASGIRMELLSVGARQLQSMLFRVPPGTGSDGAYSHEGEEFIYMLSGTLELWLDELDCHTLREGDGFWFESRHGHRWFNPLKKDAVLLWVNTPPTF